MGVVVVFSCIYIVHCTVISVKLVTLDMCAV